MKRSRRWPNTAVTHGFSPAAKASSRRCVSASRGRPCSSTSIRIAELAYLREDDGMLAHRCAHARRSSRALADDAARLPADRRRSRGRCRSRRPSDGDGRRSLCHNDPAGDWASLRWPAARNRRSREERRRGRCRSTTSSSTRLRPPSATAKWRWKYGSRCRPTHVRRVPKNRAQSRRFRDRRRPRCS